ncbi:MAG: Lrp/AsnC family transcriptional regulator [Calditrichia bacterium]
MKIGAYVLIGIYPNKISDVIKYIENLDSVKQVHAVTGPYDSIAYLEAKDMKELSQLILSEIQNLDGVRDTTTCLVIG